jgi:uncharacterized protein (TIGR00730 family)
MEAGIEGAGAEHAFGVSIRLPFESTESQFLADDPKLINFRYFFTRKVAFIKEADGFVLLPGGFGTLDEAFELLTLIQTGKSYPAPIVLLDHPGSTYWSSWRRFVTDELLEGQMVSANDLDLFLHTHDPDEAAEYLCAFYSCYHSLRFVGKRLVLRLRSPISPEGLVKLKTEFTDIVVSGQIEAIEATGAERRDSDHVELARVAFRFDNRSFARLVQLIHRINDLGGRHGAAAAGDLVHDVAPDVD